VTDGWCWFVLREEYCWLVAGGWFDVREKYCWLVADKPSEQGEHCKSATAKTTAASSAAYGYPSDPVPATHFSVDSSEFARIIEGLCSYHARLLTVHAVINS
jgi:hypothetical protein